MQTHDLNGNVTYDGRHTYVWDAFNRLAQVKDGTTVVATYSYDTPWWLGLETRNS